MVQLELVPNFKNSVCDLLQRFCKCAKMSSKCKFILFQIEVELVWNVLNSVSNYLGLLLTIWGYSDYLGMLQTIWGCSKLFWSAPNIFWLFQTIVDYLEIFWGDSNYFKLFQTAFKCFKYFL